MTAITNGFLGAFHSPHERTVEGPLFRCFDIEIDFGRGGRGSEGGWRVAHGPDAPRDAWKQGHWLLRVTAHQDGATLPVVRTCHGPASCGLRQLRRHTRKQGASSRAVKHGPRVCSCRARPGDDGPGTVCWSISPEASRTVWWGV